MKKLVLFALLILTVGFSSYSGLLSSLKANGAAPISNPLLQQQQQQLQLPDIAFPLRSPSLTPNTTSPNTASVPHAQKTTTITSAVDGNNSLVQNGGTTTSNSITFTFAFGGAGGTTNNNPVVVAPGVTSGNTRYTSGIAGFQCSLDSASPVSCTSPATVHNLAVGNHIFQVRAIDTAGNREANGASFSWAVSLSTSSSLQPATTPRPSTTVPSIDGTSTASAAPVNSSITTSTNAMPTSLDSAKAHLAEAMKDIKLGNIQGEVMQIRITNQTITQFQQGMQSIMNVHRTPSALMTDGGNTSQQQAMLNIMNTKGVPSPLMMGNGQGNPHR